LPDGVDFGIIKGRVPTRWRNFLKFILKKFLLCLIIKVIKVELEVIKKVKPAQSRDKLQTSPVGVSPALILTCGGNPFKFDFGGVFS